jgi:hypothetical protein
MNPLVSFVVPCYQLGHVLPECIESILTQTYQNFEILIMDNCSPDNTPEVARSFCDPRVRHIRNEENIGHTANFNRGITLSQGKYVWWLSADDLLQSSRALERFVELMERNPQVGYVFCRSIEVQGGKKKGIAQWTDCGADDLIWDGRAFLARLFEFNCIAESSAMVRKQCYERVGLFRLDLPFASDWYLWCSIALHYDVAYFSDPMVCWRNWQDHSDSLTAVFSQDHTCISDEIAVLSDAGLQTKDMGIPVLCSLARSALVHRVLRTLKPPLGHNHQAALTGAQLRAILRVRIRDKEERRLILTRLYSELTNEADQHYWQSDYTESMRSYQLAISIRPWSLKTRAKCLLLRIDSLGRSVRRLSRQLR